jgi:hypothetical protein
MSAVLESRAKADTSRRAPPLHGLLQRKCGCGTHTPAGGSCQSCADKTKGLQRKLSLGAANDPLELEADRAADQVLRRAGSIGINPSPPAIQRAPSPSPGDRSDVPESVHRVIAASGRPLDLPIRREMEQGFGHDFSQVRIHHGSAAEKSAKDVEARAYTVGSSIVFGEGQFAPSTGEGRRLLAHELAHVAQQTAPGPANQQGGGNPARAGADLLQRTPAAPTNASGAAPRDLSRIRIDPIADFVASSLTAPRSINAQVSDPAVVHMSWEFYDPTDRFMPGSFTTLPGNSTSTSAPFTLQPSHFSGAGFTPGRYLLRCVGRGSNHQPVAYADRDFNVLSADLTTGTALATTYGSLTYTNYTKTDATPANSRFTVDVTIQFLPTNAVACSQVGWIQAVQGLNADGTSRQANISAEQDARKTPLAWAIDQLAGVGSPFYVIGRTGAGTLAPDSSFGTFGSGGAHPTSAGMIDQPSSAAPVVYRFEACAVCRTGTSAGQVYGCTTWGYSSNSAGQVTLMPRGFRQMPSDQFREAGTSWNNWRSGFPAAAQPEASPAMRSP